MARPRSRHGGQCPCRLHHQLNHCRGHCHRRGPPDRHGGAPGDAEQVHYLVSVRLQGPAGTSPPPKPPDGRLPDGGNATPAARTCGSAQNCSHLGPRARRTAAQREGRRGGPSWDHATAARHQHFLQSCSQQAHPPSLHHIGEEALRRDRPCGQSPQKGFRRGATSSVLD